MLGWVHPFIRSRFRSYSFRENESAKQFYWAVPRATSRFSLHFRDGRNKLEFVKKWSRVVTEQTILPTNRFSRAHPSTKKKKLKEKIRQLAPRIVFFDLSIPFENLQLFEFRSMTIRFCVSRIENIKPTLHELASLLLFCFLRRQFGFFIGPTPDNIF